MRKCNLFYVKYFENERLGLIYVIIDFVNFLRFFIIINILKLIDNIWWYMYNYLKIVCLYLSLVRNVWNEVVFRFSLEDIIN